MGFNLLCCILSVSIILATTGNIKNFLLSFLFPNGPKSSNLMKLKVWCFFSVWNLCCSLQVLGDDDKRARYDRGEDMEDMGMGGGGGGGGNPFGGGGQQFSFHFEGGFPGGGFDGGFPGGYQFHFWHRWNEGIIFCCCKYRRFRFLCPNQFD